MPRETRQHECGARPDLDDLSLVVDECPDFREEMRHTVHDERYEGIILQTLRGEYERGRTASYERLDFGLDEIRHMVHTTYVDNLSLSFKPKPVAGRGIAIQVVGDNISDVKCDYCKGVGHVIQDCAVLKEKEHRRGANLWGQQLQRKQNLPRHAKTGPGDPIRGGDRNSWCSFHRSIPHSDTYCRTQHGVSSENTGNANYAGSHYIDHHVSFTVVKAPTDIDTSGLFRSFGRVSGKVAGKSLSMVQE